MTASSSPVPVPPRTFRSRTVGIAIDRPPQAVYDFAVTLENLPQWASGLGAAGRRDGDDWVAQMEVGTVRIRFVARNDLGVLDHHVTLPSGEIVYSPMRVIANGAGSEVSFTLFQLPSMTDAQFDADARTVERDLTTLKTVVERSPLA